jgi:hypothetical protein
MSEARFCTATLQNILQRNGILQPLREAFAEPCRYRYILLGRDRKLGGEGIRFFKASGLEPKRTSRQAPWQNGVAEPWMGSCRREILEHVMALNEPHRRRLLRDSVNYQEQERRPDSLEKDAPNRPTVEPRPETNATVIGIARLGGLHHRYSSGAVAGSASF